MLRRFMVIAVLAGIAASGCRRPVRLVLTKDQRIRIAHNILKAEPKPMFRSGAVFGNNIKLIGIDMQPKEVKPGQTLKITYYWKCLRPVKGPWKVFVHFELPRGQRMMLDHQPIHELYPVRNWKAGQVIRDVQDVTVERNAHAGIATLWLGLYNVDVYKTQGGGDRMKLTNPDKVTNDGHNRIKGATVRILPKGKHGIKDSRRKSTKMHLNAMRLMKKNIVVDGNLDEQDWRTAFHTKPFQKAGGGIAAPEDRTIAALIYDEKYLYIGFKVTDSDIHSSFKNRDDTIWKQDAVEVYLDPLQDGRDYIELQVSPANKVFDALFSSHRTPDWPKADKYNIPGLKTAVRLHGTLNNSKDVDVGWDVEIAVPWKALKGIKDFPPKNGTRMTINFFRINYNKDRIAGAFAFSPTNGDFHNLKKAGEAVFIGYPTDMLRKGVLKGKRGLKNNIRNTKPMLHNIKMLKKIIKPKLNPTKQIIRMNRLRQKKHGQRH